MRFRVPCGIVKILKYLKMLGENIRTPRRNLGRSQEKLAEKSDLHHNYIGDIERGEENVFVDALNVSAFAGSLAQLTFSITTGKQFGDFLYFDDIQFSSSPIPEPSAF